MEHRLPWANDWVRKPLRCLAGDSFFEGSSQRTHNIINPTTGRKLAEFKIANALDVERTATLAEQAKKEWKLLAKNKRIQSLHAIAAVIREHAAELATLESLCNGKLYKEAVNDDLPESAEVFEYYAGWIDKYYGETCPVGPGFLNYTLHEPVGVCALIVPWNFPLLLACWKIAPALAMGNTVIVKPSEYTPLSVIRLCELIVDKKILPTGVINLLLGDEETGQAISQSSKIDKISFTGSTAVGKLIAQQAALSNLKGVTLELGGKSPNIIFADAPDLQAAIDRSFTAMFSHKGEKCSEPTKLLVERSAYKDVVAGLVAKAEGIVCGDPFAPSSQQGPQCHAQHFAKINNYIDIGKKDGSRLVAGGSKVGSDGYFIAPTIFADVPKNSKLAREEIFGPVLVVLPFDSDEEAIELANDSSYGLAAGLWTRDITRAHRIAGDIDAGMIFINRYGCYDFSSPFGGIKQSGWGKEMGIHSLEAYTRLKSIWVKL